MLCTVNLCSHSTDAVLTAAPKTVLWMPMRVQRLEGGAGKLSAAASVPSHVVRYYARIGLLTPARDPANNYRRFDERDLRRLQFIRRAKLLGCSLQEIRRILRDAGHGRTPCPEVREILLRRVRDSRERLITMQNLQRYFERTLRAMGKMPDGQRVRALIESKPVEQQPSRRTGTGLGEKPAPRRSLP